MPMMLEMLDDDFKQFGGQMRGEYAFFLQLFKHCQEGNIVVGLDVLHPEDLNHIARKTVSN